MSLKHLVHWCVGSLCIGLLWVTSACASGVAGRQVIVQFKQPIQDTTEIARTVSQSTGLRALFVSSSSSVIHAVKMECFGLEQCEAALEKLRKDPALVSAEWDQRVYHRSTKPNL